MTAFDLTGWTRVAVTGADAVKFLQNFCTNDLLKAKCSCEAFFTSEKARVLGHGWLLKDQDGSVQFVGTPDQGPGLIAHLSKYALMEDVEFADESGDPLWFESRTDGWPEGDPLEGGTFYLCDPSEDAWRLSEEARIAAKLPRIGTDLTEANLCMEADRPWAICYTKGCYLGQEPVARVRALGRVNKLLRGLTIPHGSPPAEQGAIVTCDGEAIGVVTSAAGNVALGMLKRKWAEPGTAVQIDGIDATVF
ncbi:CAF17-like 4Fe-4S cluster assembly/insertion protein YgfZ [Alienimonas californiensis]|uniref:Putative global regulator n=1 Tax=Alienimonas californiensis TaxID=2527989 RepID=A0A517P4Q9_9PLAN|nr:glycine cleavage T C-terminal barrel domain-containing protein [Alienimonas californiensis]QDT14335.1 putative global regulator [Alienimonas californiensis]